MDKQELIQLIEKTEVFKSFPVFKQILTLKKSNLEDLQDLLHQAEKFGIDYLKQNPRLQSTTVKLIGELLILNQK